MRSTSCFLKAQKRHGHHRFANAVRDGGQAFALPILVPSSWFSKFLFDPAKRWRRASIAHEFYVELKAGSELKGSSQAIFDPALIIAKRSAAEAREKDGFGAALGIQNGCPKCRFIGGLQDQTCETSPMQ